MQIPLSPDPYEDDFPVHMNPGSNGDHFGVLKLGDGLNLHIETDEDADRLIRAAARLKAMRAAIGSNHEYAQGAGKYGSHCEICGLLADVHAEPADVKGTNPYPVTAAACTRGEHASCVLSVCGCLCHTPTLPQRTVEAGRSGDPNPCAVPGEHGHYGPLPEGAVVVCTTEAHHAGPEVEFCSSADCTRRKDHEPPHRDHRTGREWASSADNHAVTVAVAAVDSEVVGTPFPGRDGYFTGRCGHAVAGSEWRAGFRTCERCPTEMEAPDDSDEALAAEAAEAEASQS